MKDYIIRATAGNDSVRIFVAYTKDMVQAARFAHNTTPVASAALGRTLTAGALMSTTLKNEKDLLTIQIAGDGPAKGITVTADSQSNVKGYINNPDIDLPLNEIGKLDVRGALGNGYLTIIKDIGLKHPYVGKTQLVSGEIAEDFTYYFTTSEQTPSAVALGVLVDTDTTIKQAGGFILQLMPSCPDDVISTIEKNMSGITSMTNLFEEGKTPEDILEILCNGLDYKIHEKRDTEFKCNCSKERMEKALISIGKKDLTEILENDKQAEINCHFCNSSYKFDEEELKDIIEKI